MELCGQAAESRMLAATGGINTHRGAIFMLGLLCAAAGAAAADQPAGYAPTAATIRAALLRLWGDALQARCGRRRVRSAGQAREALARQIGETVRWDDCLDLVAAQHVDAVLEIGPGQALARMWTARHPGVPARSADEFRSLPAVVAWLRRHLAAD